MASSQIPPMDKSRASGLVAALKYPSGNPLAAVSTLVEPSRSADAESIAP